MTRKLRIVLSLVLSNLFIPCFLFAAPTRNSVPVGLFPAYDNPQFLNNAPEGSTDIYGPHIDKFYDQTGSEQTVFSVEYNIDEPILFYSLRGAKFVSITDDAINKKVIISFSPYINFGDKDDAIYLALFTNSLVESSTAEQQTVKSLIRGARFDSKFSRLDRTPFIIPESSEDYFGYKALSFQFSLGSNGFYDADNARIFLPTDLLTIFGTNLNASHLFLKRYTADGTLFFANHFDTAQNTEGGVLFDLTKEQGSKTYGWKFELSKTPANGMTSSKKQYFKGENIYLRGYIKNCNEDFSTSLEIKKTSYTDFKKVRGFNVKGCEFNAVMTSNQTAEYRFKFKKKYYSRKVIITKKSAN